MERSDIMTFVDLGGRGHDDLVEWVSCRIDRMII